MKILYIGLLSHYTDGMTYQDNMLSEENVKQGHEVLYISDCQYFSDGRLIETIPGKIKLKNGITLIRLPFVSFLNKKITTKIGKVKGLKNIIEDYRPDVIYHHGAFGIEIFTVLGYIKKTPNVNFYVDSHSDYNNGAKKKVHKLIYKYVLSIPLRLSFKYISKIFYITSETRDFLIELFGVKNDKLEYLPLGGIIAEDSEIEQDRKSVIQELGLNEDTIIALHSGKLKAKKRTVEMLRAFTKVNNRNLRFIIIGSIDESVSSEIENLIKDDKRILYLGWKNNIDLRRYLCAADIYIQLGTQSATMQNAACTGCALALYPFKSHIELFGNNAFYISSENDVESLLIDITENNEILKEMAKNSFLIAKSKLDYKKLAGKVTNNNGKFNGRKSDARR